MPLVAGGIATSAAALFACADTALTSISDARLTATVIEAGERFRAALTRVEKRRDRVQACYLAGRVVASVVTAGAGFAVVTSATVPEGSRVLCGVLALGAFTAILHVASTFGRRNSDWVVPRAARYLFPLELLLWPLVVMLSTLTDLVVPRRARKVDPRITETEVEIMVDQGAASGALDHGNAELIRKVLEFPELTARDAMIPRKHVVAIRLDTPLDEIADVVMKSGHSRYPVYREDVDDVFGLLYAKDLFRVLRPSAETNGHDAVSPERSTGSIGDIVREPVKIVPESRPLSELLRDMRQSRQHMAIVVDEFGGTSGVVTLEDVIEEIVGDIRDEHDPEKAPVVALPEGGLLVEGETLLCDLTSQLGRDLDPDGEFDTIGGLVTEKLGHVPSVGTTVLVDGFELVVRDADDKHVTQVAIVPKDETPLPTRSEPGGSAVIEPG